MKNIQSYAGIAFVIIVSLFLIKFFDISYPLTIISSTRSSELSVIGEGKVEAIPDTAFVDAGISINNAQTVNEVQNKMDEINNKILNGVKSIGIEKSDIKTSSYSINPNYSYDNRTNTISGYNGNVTISIKVKNTSLISKVITEITADGANQVNGVRFAIDDPAKFREQAREKAIANAKEQAAKLTAVLGIKLGRITNIAESTQSSQPVPMYDSAVKTFGLGGNEPQIEPGSQTITSVVTLYFEKK